MVKFRATVFWVDDVWREDEIRMFEDLFEKKGLLAIIINSGDVAKREIQNGLKYDLLIADFASPYFEGYYIIKMSKELNPEVPTLAYSNKDFICEEADIVLPKFCGLKKFFETIDILLARSR